MPLEILHVAAPCRNVPVSSALGITEPMCLAVYIASEHPLPEIEWSKSAPAFYLEAVVGASPVKERLEYRHVYYAGSHEGCGCGFSKDGREGNERDKCQENYDALASVVGNVVLAGGRVRLFACWEGEQSEEPTSVRSVPSGLIAEPDFELEELQLLEVVP